MGALTDIAAGALKSKVTRSLITNNASGIRSISTPGKPTPDKNGVVEVIGNLLRGTVGFVGWILGAIGYGLSFTFTAIFEQIVQASIFIVNFDFNQTDESLDKYVEMLRIQLAGQLGETLGNFSGYLLCGILPSAGIFAFNEILGLRLLAEVGEAALEELGSNIQYLCRRFLEATVQANLIYLFKATRKMIKGWLSDPTSAQSKVFDQFVGVDGSKKLQDWGKKGSEPWIISREVNNAINNIQDPVLQNFTEEFIESLFEGCIEAGYVVAGGLDEWVIEQKQHKKVLLGAEKTVEIIPNREAPDEKIVLSGNEDLLKPQVVSSIANYQLIENRDVGMIVGEALRDNIIRTKQAFAENNIRLKVTFFSNKTPPFWRRVNKKKATIAEYEIPYIDRTKLDWEKIKFACDGENGYLWGGFKAEATLVDNTGTWVGRMWANAGTEAGAIQRVKAFAALTRCEINSIDVSHMPKEGKRGTLLYVDPVQVYPAYFTVVNSQKILDEQSGRRQLTGTYKQKRDKIPLWTQTKPDDFTERIAALLAHA